MAATGDALAAVLLGDGPSGYATSPVMGMLCTEWHYPGTGPDDPDLYKCTVTDGAYTFTNCLVLHPTLLTLGRVAVVMTSAGPLVLGNTFKYFPPAPVEA